MSFSDETMCTRQGLYALHHCSLFPLVLSSIRPMISLVGITRIISLMILTSLQPTLQTAQPDSFSKEKSQFKSPLAKSSQWCSAANVSSLIQHLFPWSKVVCAQLPVESFSLWAFGLLKSSIAFFIFLPPTSPAMALWRYGLLWYLLHAWINEFKGKILLIALSFPIWSQSFNLTEFEIDWVSQLEFGN